MLPAPFCGSVAFALSSRAGKSGRRGGFLMPPAEALSASSLDQDTPSRQEKEGKEAAGWGLPAPASLPPSHGESEVDRAGEASLPAQPMPRLVPGGGAGRHRNPRPAAARYSGCGAPSRTEMPFAELETSLPAAQLPRDLPTKLCAAVAGILGKPQERVSATVRSDAAMVVGGSAAPAAQLLVSSIGVVGSAEQNKGHSARLFDFLTQELGLAPDRIVILPIGTLADRQERDSHDFLLRGPESTKLFASADQPQPPATPSWDPPNCSQFTRGRQEAP
ncbi:uncharacterized protein LOC133373362 [Rhineura floridana]|uniref:uncharacterized protein LOC133373362 n=1 Tax=Rhineura floridana TaxID=261503 RepID=UPI002AC7EC9C|nr:uncharacterized protein LOC133373362 [Rhineura floridana]